MPPKGMFRKAKQSIRDVRQALAADTQGDYAATQSQMDAIFRNLGTAGRGAGAALTSTQARELAAIQRLVARGTARATGSVERGQAQAVSRYGSALGGAVEQQFGVARATAGATGTAARGVRAGANILAQGGQLALATQRSAAEEAGAAAEYATAVALKSRFQADATTVAQMKADLQMRRLDYRLAMKAAEQQAALDWKYRELEIDKLQGIQADDPERYAGITQAATTASQAYVGLHKLFNEKVEGQYLTPGQVALTYMANNNIEPSTAAGMFIQAIATAMYANGAGDAPGQLYGPGTSEQVREQMVLDAIQETIIGWYPDYADQAESIRTYLESTANAQYSLNAVGLLAQTDDRGWIGWDWDVTAQSDEERRAR